MANVWIDLNPEKKSKTRASLAVWSHTNSCLNRFDNQEMTTVHMLPILLANICFRGHWSLWLWKSLRITSGVSGAEVERACGCLSCYPKATASLCFGLNESSVGTVWMEILTVSEYFVRKRFTTCIKSINTIKQTQIHSSLCTRFLLWILSLPQHFVKS